MSNPIYDDQLPLTDNATHAPVAPVISVHVSLTTNACLATNAIDLFLSVDEHDRSGRFKSARLRQLFVAGRNWLRAILSHHTQTQPEALCFSTNCHGKPHLVEPKTDLHFNFSRSEEHCICVVARGRNVGIDIEQFHPMDDLVNVAKTVFSSRDLDTWRGLASDHRERAFIRCWTRKEAIVKAHGIGISNGVKPVSVPILKNPMNTCGLVTQEEKQYLLSDIVENAETAASLAVEVNSNVVGSSYRDTSHKLPDAVQRMGLTNTTFLVREFTLQS